MPCAVVGPIAKAICEPSGDQSALSTVMPSHASGHAGSDVSGAVGSIHGVELAGGHLGLVQLLDDDGDHPGARHDDDLGGRRLARSDIPVGEQRATRCDATESDHDRQSPDQHADARSDADAPAATTARVPVGGRQASSALRCITWRSSRSMSLMRVRFLVDPALPALLARPRR